MRVKTLSFFVILIMGTAVDVGAQSLVEPWDKFLERLERRLQEYPTFSDKAVMYERQRLLETLRGLREGQRAEFTENYLQNRSWSREYCAADYGSAPPSRRPYRWCAYDDMVSCLEATSGNHCNYSCELNQFYRHDERNPFYLSR